MVKRLLNKQELADELQITIKTLYKFKNQGMPCIKISHNIVRYELEEVITWFKNRQEKGE